MTTPTKSVNEYGKLDKLLSMMWNMKMEMNYLKTEIWDMNTNMKEISRKQNVFREEIGLLKKKNKLPKTEYGKVKEEN